MTSFPARNSPPGDYLAVALDVSSEREAQALVTQLGEAVKIYKIGLELLMSGGYFQLLEWLKLQGKRVFVDLKLFDVPATVGRAVTGLRRYGADWCTVHGNQGMMEAAAQAGGDEISILAVTALTSLDQADLEDLGFECRIEQLVLSRARRAMEAGCAGVVTSGLELPMLRRELPASLITVIPGIRPLENKTVDDQRRVVTPENALKAGADLLVIGRPITRASDPAQAAGEILLRMGEVLSSRMETD